MGYLTIKEEAIAEFEEKKSIFIGQVKRVETEEEAKAFITQVRNAHKEARHHVYAYMVGEHRGIQRYSDDGEPQGTGGIPVLEVMKKNDITDAVVVVTRYFGGILLGTGGLARAYSKGASLAIQQGGVVEKVMGCPLKITLDYDLLGKVQYHCAQNQWHIENTLYTDKVEIIIYCTLPKVEELEQQITEVTSGKGIFERGEEDFFFKMENRLYPVQA